MHALGCLLVFLLWGFFLLFGIGLHVLRTLGRFFGLGSKQQPGTSSRTRTQQPAASPSDKKKKKIFTDDVGEYVDYEEI